MKTIRFFSILGLFLAIANLSFAQEVKTEALKVSGECGMCKKKIEKAAKEAGATYAIWSTNTKVLTIRYNSLSTNSAKIQQKVAGVGYDTPDFKATDEAYNKLDQCCQYDREEAAANETMNKGKSCCDKGSGPNAKMDCSKKGADGKAAMNCGDSKKSCCDKKTQQ
jgi:mercuric ion binding protein